MQKFVIILLLALLIFSSSIIYKQQKAHIFHNFPIEELGTDINSDSERPLYLLLFFSKRNCRDCLQIVGVLNQLSSPFKVIGFVPRKELLDEVELRKITGAKFKLREIGKMEKYLSLYAPTILGVSQNGHIMMMIPAVPNEDAYFQTFITDFYEKVSLMLIKTPR